MVTQWARCVPNGSPTVVRGMTNYPQIHVQAIEEAIADIQRISSFDPNERLPKEEQIRCAMYNAYRQRDLVVHAEAGYPATQCECDLRVHGQLMPETWIEIKTVWSGAGWVNKPVEQVRGIQSDFEKLESVRASANCMTVVFGFFDRPAAETPLGEMILDLNPKWLAFDSGNRRFHWRGENLSVLRAWSWLLPRDPTH